MIFQVQEIPWQNFETLRVAVFLGTKYSGSQTQHTPFPLPRVRNVENVRAGTDIPRRMKSVIRHTVIHIKA